MAGTVTQTETPRGAINLIAYDWASSTGGEATHAATIAINGEIMRAVFVPDGSTTAPTDNYDVTLTDANGIDLLAGQGANLSATDTIVVTDDIVPLFGSTLNLSVSNAGDSKGGLIYIYMKVL